MAANQITLESLHDLLAKEYIKQLEDGTLVLDKDGEQVALSPSPALLTSIAKFLKDNGIDCDPAENPQMGALREAAGDVLQFPFDPNRE